MRAGRGSARRGLARRWALAVVVVVALAGSCASEADESPLGGGQPEAASGDRPADFEATASYLDKASDQSTGEAHRIEMSMAVRADVEGQRLDVEAPVLTGEEDDGRFEMHMDMGQWVDEMSTGLGAPGALGDLDLTMDMVGDEQTLYMRAPFYAALLAEAPPGTDLGPIEDLAVMSDRWGRIDLTQLDGFSLGQVQGTMGGPAGSDPRVLLDLVAGADDVEDLGSDEIDGTVVHGLAARLSMADMLEAQGTDPEDFVNQMAAGMGGASGLDAEAAADRLLALEIPFEVWVDGAGYVRRVAYEMDMAAMLGSSVDSGIGAGGLEEFVLGTTMDFSDYGDESIAIEVPANAIDVTEAYREMLRASAAQAAGAAGDPQGS